MAKFYIHIGCLIVIMLHMVRAHPLINMYNIKELDNLKDLIQRLEDRLTVNEETEVYPGYEGLDPEVEDDNSPVATRGEEDRMIMNSPNRLAPDNSIVSRLKDLAGLTRTAKSFSSCFGNRLERIGSWSGLGCNSIKTGNKKTIFGN